MKKFVFLLAGLLCMFASCSGGGNENPETPTPTPTPEETASITLDATSVTFDAAGGEKSFTFSTNKDWTLSVASTTSGTTWCTASATSGTKGDATVKFTITENTDYDDRSVSVTIKAGTASKSFTVTQKSAEGLLVTTKKYEVAQEGGSIEVEVKANINYQLEISETAKSWITEAKSRALTSKKHAFSIALNEKAEKREGEIYIKSDDKVETVKVYQAGGPIILLSKNEYTVSDAGETISVDINSNVEFGVQLPDVDWITDVASARGMSSHTLQYTIAANEGYDSRSAEIIFYDKNSSLRDTLKVLQAQKDAIILSKKEINVKSEGETIEVKLSANVDFEVTMPEVDWISQVSTRGLTRHTLYYKVAENTGNDSRSAKIVFYDKYNELKDTLIVVQSQNDVIILSQKEYNVTSSGGKIEVKLDTNVEFGVQLPDVDWITDVATVRGMSSHTLQYTILPNETYDSRLAEIIFYDKNSSLRDTLKVMQAQKDAIILSKKEVSVKSEGETIEVKLSANVDFEVTMPEVDWISLVSTRGLTEHTLYYKVAENVGVEKRNSEIVFKDKSSQLSDKLTITQFGSLQEGYTNGVVTVATAGSMKKLIGDDYLNITSLKVIGFINGDDVYYLRKMFGCRDFYEADRGKLTALDLSEAFVVEGGGTYYDYYSTSNNMIGDYMFYRSANLQSIKLPDNVTEIGESAFADCSSLTSVNIPDKVTSLAKSAFAGCSSLTSVNIPDNVTEIGESAFYGCSSLTTVNIPDNVIEIGEYAFSNCSDLMSITIGDGVKYVPAYLCYGCNKLSEVKIGKNVKSLGEGSFLAAHDYKENNYIHYIDKFYCYASTPPKQSYKFTDKTSISPFRYEYDADNIIYNNDRLTLVKIKTLYVPLRCSTIYRDEWDNVTIENLVEMD